MWLIIGLLCAALIISLAVIVIQEGDAERNRLEFEEDEPV